MITSISFSAIDALDAINDIGKIVDESGAILDSVYDSVVQKLGSLGIEGLIKKLALKFTN